MFVRQCSGVKKTGTSIVLNKKCLFQAVKIQVDNVGEALPVFTDRAVTHYEKIYNRDVNILNELIKGTPDEKKSLATLIMENSYDEDARKIKIFNYASQVYNHSLYVSSLVPFGQPKSDWMNKKLALHFGSVDQFERVFVMNANGVYGSGWTWLIDNDSNLEVCNGFNSGNPVGRNRVTPLLCINLWEHAYFPDFRLNRVVCSFNILFTHSTDRSLISSQKEYVARWLESVNWAVVEKKLKQLHGDSESDLKSFREFQQNVDNIAHKKLAENQFFLKNYNEDDGEGEDDLKKVQILRQKQAHQKARQHTSTATKTRE